MKWFFDTRHTERHFEVGDLVYPKLLPHKLDLEKGMMDCLYAKCTPCITDRVMTELEKLGQKYRVALRTAKDPRFERLLCTHKATYADDCLVERVTQVTYCVTAISLSCLPCTVFLIFVLFI